MLREEWVMIRSRRARIGLALTLGFAVVAPAAQADLIRDVGVALGYAGFDIEGRRNILSGGEDYRISRNLLGTPLDFGAGELALQGPISLELSTGKRCPATLDIALQTAMNSDLSSSPLAYLFQYDVGGQSTEVSGTVYIDASLSINQFGWYTAELTYSSRQNVERDGRFANDSDTYDYDIGPINVSGNIFADALALITDPFFEATGQFNPFESFSGRAEWQKLFDTSTSQARRDLAGGDSLMASIMSPLLAPGAMSEPVHGPLPLPAGTQAVGAAGVVPEPTVLLLMLLGVPMVAARRPRR
jgi:hypothetical protein